MATDSSKLVAPAKGGNAVAIELIEEKSKQRTKNL
jgi:hypothetical protein